MSIPAEFIASQVKTKFMDTLSSMQQSLENYVKKPGVHFTRHRRLPFRDTILLTMSMQTGCLDSELLDYWQFRSVNQDSTASYLTAPSRACFIHQRAKLNERAFPALLSQFNAAFPFTKRFKGLHLLACDGSDLNIAPTPGDDSTFISYNSKNGGYHQLHLTVMYDLLEKRYTDAVVQPRAEANENAAFITMLKRNPLPEKTLFIADRGFSSFDVMAVTQHLNQFYLIRLKEADSDLSPFHALLQPDSAQFDISSEFFISRSRKAIPGASPDQCKYIRPDRSFSLIDVGDCSSCFHLPFRFIKITLSNGSPEYLVTNLPKDEFPTEDFLQLYHWRWGIETSFLFLKYGICLAFPHAIKREFQIQEIFAKLILYNFVSLIVSGIHPPASAKYAYRLSFSNAIRFCRRFLLIASSPHDDIPLFNALHRNKVPIRSFKDRPRNMRSQRLNPFQNRH